MGGFFVRVRIALTALLVLTIVPGVALAVTADPRPRPVQGSEIISPPDIYSQNSVLSVTLDYSTNILVTPAPPPKGGSVRPTHQANVGKGSLKKASAGGAATRA